MKDENTMREQDNQRGVYIPEYSEEDSALAKEWAEALPNAEHPGYVPQGLCLNPNTRF